MKRRFFRCFTISFVIIGCVTVGAFGIAKAYENTRRVGFGEYKSAIEINEDNIRILDLEIF